MTPDPAQVDVAELRALLEAATPGPWYATNAGSVMSAATTTPVETGSFGRYLANSRAIAAARNALPALLDRLEAAETKVAAVAALADDLERHSQRSPVDNQSQALVRTTHGNTASRLRKALESTP